MKRDKAASGSGSPTEPTGSAGRGGATERTDFGPSWPEVGERSPRQRGPKSQSGKFRQESEQPRPSGRLRQEDETPPHDGGGASDPKAAKEARRFEKAGQKAEKTGAKLDAAKEKLANQKPSKRPGPIKKAGGAVAHGTHRFVHGKIYETEHENVGVEGGHRAELAGEAVLRGGTRAAKRYVRNTPTRQVRKWERKDIRAKANFEVQRQAQEHPELNKSAISRFWQKQRQKQQYAKQAREAAKQGAKAAKKTAVTTEKLAVKVAAFVRRHPVGVLIALACVLLIVVLQSCVSTLTTLGNGTISAVVASTYPSEDADMLAAEAAYVGMENELQNYLDIYENTHDYNEYHYDLDEIEHDPYVLISILTAWHEGAWTIDEAQGTLQMLFDRKYILTETVEVEVRYRTETDTWTETDPETGETITYTDTYEVPYNYYICTVELENFNLSHLPIYIMGEEKVGMYALYIATLGNRPDLFSGTVLEPTLHDIPKVYLADETFAAMIEEAEKYIGYPYVWGGSSPKTSFDCSGFVSWVINHSGWDVGRLGAQGLCNICTPVSSANVRPGDLVFFVGTYDTPGVSHVGIYVGDGWMIHAGNPIGYANLNTSYWQSHFYAYGRLP